MSETSNSENLRAQLGSKIFYGKQQVESLISKWHILTPLFIALPHSAHFKPVMLVNNYKEKAFISNKKKSLFSIYYVLFVIMLLIPICFYVAQEKLVGLTLLGLITFFYLVVEHLVVSININSVKKETFLYLTYQISIK